MYIPEKGVLKNSNTYFHTPSSIAKSMFFYLKCAGHFFCQEGYCVKRDSYDSFLLMYIKDGQGSVVYDHKTYTTGKGDVVILNCNHPHMYSTSSWETLWIHFDGNISRDFFNLLFERFGCVIALNESLVIPKLLSAIVNEFKEDRIPKEPLVSCDIQRMLTELMMISAGNAGSSSDGREGIISNAIAYITNNYKNKITLEQLSSSVNMSPFYFSRIFKKETGYSPYEYIIMVRINEAKRLLKGSNLLVKEVAFKVGFHSESSFVSSFRKNTKFSPMEFRNMIF